MSAAWRISSGTTSSPSVCAAALVSSISSTGWALPALNTMPNRRRPATTSRNSSIRLPARLAACSDKPVTWPPGLARLATRPLPTGSMPTAKTIGMALVACRTVGTGAADGDDDVHFHPDEFRGNFGVSIGASFGPPILDGDCTVLDPADLAQSRHKGARPRTEGRGIGAEKADCRQSCLLRFRRQRPCCRRAADQRDEIAPSHWLPPRDSTAQPCFCNYSRD